MVVAAVASPATVSFLLIALLVAGCGRLGRAEPTPTPVELSMVTFDPDGAWGRAEEALTEQFRTDYPYVTFNRSGYMQDPDQYLETTPLPDIMMMVSSYWLATASARGRLLNVSDLWEQTGLNTAFPAGMQALSRVNGNQYFVPLGYGWTAIYYNAAIFDDLNLAPPQTWNEFLLLCDTLQANGITPLSLAGDGDRLGMLWFDLLNLRINGAEFHRQLLAGELSFDEDRVRAVVEVWQHLLAQGYFVEEPERVNGLNSLTAVVRGDEGRLSGPKAAMVLVDSTSVAEMPVNFQSELDFFRFPVMDPVTPVAEALYVYGYVAPVGGEHVDQVLAYLSYAASPPAQTILVQQFNQGAAVFAPANTEVDDEGFSTQLRQGMALVGDADDVAGEYVLSLPFTQWFYVDQALGSFLRDPARGEDFVLALEAIRLRGIEESWLPLP